MKRRNAIQIAVILMFLLALAGCGKADRHAETEEERKEEVAREAEPEKEATEDEETEAMESQEPEEPEQPEKKGILIALDPGHQGWDVDMSALEANAPGSSQMKAKASTGTSGSYSGVPEFQLNLDIALMVRDRLTAQGYDVIMTREDNSTAISNAERAALANDAGADISVRIHANGSEDSSVNGALVLTGSPQNPYVGGLYEDSKRLGENVLNAYCAATGMQNLGLQQNDTMTGINWSTIPVIILEMGFMTNEQDDLNMASQDYRERMADGIVDGINAYYGY